MARTGLRAETVSHNSDEFEGPHTRPLSLPLNILQVRAAAQLLGALVSSVVAADFVEQVTAIDGDTVELQGRAPEFARPHTRETGLSGTK
jgi:hypothetical protein